MIFCLQTSQLTGLARFYSLSYVWYTLIAVIFTVIIGLIASFIARELCFASGLLKMRRYRLQLSHIWLVAIAPPWLSLSILLVLSNRLRYAKGEELPGGEGDEPFEVPFSSNFSPFPWHSPCGGYTTLHISPPFGLWRRDRQLALYDVHFIVCPMQCIAWHRT